jgi:hypothetical protein
VGVVEIFHKPYLRIMQVILHGDFGHHVERKISTGKTVSPIWQVDLGMVCVSLFNFGHGFSHDKTS